VARLSWASTTRRFWFFSASPPRGADDLIDKPCQIHRLGIEFELAGFDLREVQYLVDEPQFSISVLIRWRLGSN
jgi:hypothetical protein